MYSIYVGDKLIYAPTLYRESYDVIDPTLSHELNRADALSFTLLSTNPNYDAVQKLTPEIKVYDEDARIFRGRAVSISTDFNKQKSVSAEGELAYLNDAVLRPYTYSGTVKGYLTMLINAYNAQVDSWKRFEVGEVDVPDEDGNDYITRANSEYPTVFEEIKSKLLDNLGGYLIPRCEVEDGVEVNYLDYLLMEEEGHMGEQVIRFAHNLLDLNDASDADEIYTVIVPLGAKTSEAEDAPRLGIYGYIQQEGDPPWAYDYITNDAGVAKFGRIERVVIWDDVTSAANLWKKANAAVAKASGEEQSIELSALDMHDLGTDVAALKIGEWNRLISVPHGYQNGGEKRNTFQLSRIVRKLQAPDKSTYTFGRVEKTLTRR